MYDSNAPMPEAQPIPDFDHLDDFLLEPVDGEKLLEKPDYSFELNVTMNNLADGAN